MPDSISTTAPVVPPVAPQLPTAATTVPAAPAPAAPAPTETTEAPTIPALVETKANPNAPTAAPAPAAPAEQPEEAKKKPTPFSWKDEFDGLDKNKDGKIPASKLKLPKTADANKDGQVDYKEYRSHQVKANSFEGLDKDHSGTLDAKELSRMRRYDDRAYGDGQTVTKDQFQKTRQSELRDNRDARWAQKFKKGEVDKAQLEKMKRFAGKDGKLSAEEYVAGRKQLWREWHGNRRDMLFEAAGGKKGVLDVSTKAGARYKGYDGDGDGKVSKDEFKKGYMADLHSAWKARVLNGGIADADLRQRLAYGKDSYAEKIEMPKAMADKYESRNQWFISQYGTKYNTKEDVPGWDNANCGPTSLTMVAKAFGKIDPNAAEADAAIEKTRRLMGDSQSERSGTSAPGIARGAKAYGLDADIIGDINLGKIQGELKKGRLPIINGNVIRPDGSYGGGHYYVVTKIENGKAYLNDPYSKTGPSVVSTDRLMHSINTHWSHQMISIGDKG